MANIQISTEEFYNLCNQLYPTESQRVMAELKAAKFEQLYNEATNEQGESNAEVEALREVPRATGTDRSGSDS